MGWTLFSAAVGVDLFPLLSALFTETEAMRLEYLKSKAADKSVRPTH